MQGAAAWNGGGGGGSNGGRRALALALVVMGGLVLLAQPADARSLRSKKHKVESSGPAQGEEREGKCIAMDEQCSGMGWRLPPGSSGHCCDGYVCESVDAFYGTCVLAASVHKDLGPIAPQTSVSVKPLPEGQAHNYDQALYLSLLFYEAQRSGPLPPTKRIPWRGDSATQDRGQRGEDLTGGYSDGPSSQKVMLPAAWTTTVLAWGVLEFGEAYQAAGEYDNALDTLRWSYDYMIKAHTALDEFYVQVGDQSEFSTWGPPEAMITGPRVGYKVTCANPGTEPAAEAAAALAAGSMVFAEADAAYAQTLLKHARQLYDFADRCRGNFISDGHITEAAPFYSSNNGYLDELAWAALFLHKATGETRYLEAAESHYPSCCSASKLAAGPKHGKAGGGGGKAGGGAVGMASSAFTWDDKAPGVQLLLHNATGKARYANDAAAFLAAWVEHVPRTPGGLAYFAFTPLQYAASASFLALVAAEQGINPAANRRFAQQQVHYMLGLERFGPGDTSQKNVVVQGVPNDVPGPDKVWSNITSPTVSANARQSFLVGFGPKSPQSPHHRASSCSNSRGNSTCSCSEKSNFFVLFGALVGGPLPDDSYADDCQDFEANYVSLVGNAGFTSAVAGLKQLAMRGHRN